MKIHPDYGWRGPIVVGYLVLVILLLVPFVVRHADRWTCQLSGGAFVSISTGEGTCYT